MGRSRPSDELAEEDLSSACGVNSVAQGFKIWLTLASNSSKERGAFEVSPVVALMLSWPELGCELGDVIVNSGVMWKAQELSICTVVFPEELI